MLRPFVPTIIIQYPSTHEITTSLLISTKYIFEVTFSARWRNLWRGLDQNWNYFEQMIVQGDLYKMKLILVPIFNFHSLPFFTHFWIKNELIAEGKSYYNSSRGCYMKKFHLRITRMNFWLYCALSMYPISNHIQDMSSMQIIRSLYELFK